MKAIEQYFHVVLFIMLYKVALSLWMKPKCVTTQMKANEQCFHVKFWIFFHFFALTCYHAILALQIVTHSHHQLLPKPLQFQLLVRFLSTWRRLGPALSLLIQLLCEAFYFNHCNGQLFLFFHEQGTHVIQFFS